MTILVPYKPLSWNVLARKNHWTYTRTFKEMAEATKYGERKGTMPKPPVDIVVTCLWKGKRRHDIDSIVFKPILDQLVRDGLLPDDSLEYVRSVTYRGETGCDHDGYEIIITPIHK